MSLLKTQPVNTGMLIHIATLGNFNPNEFSYLLNTAADKEPSTERRDRATMTSETQPATQFCEQILPQETSQSLSARYLCA